MKLSKFWIVVKPKFKHTKLAWAYMDFVLWPIAKYRMGPITSNCELTQLAVCCIRGWILFPPFLIVFSTGHLYHTCTMYRGWVGGGWGGVADEKFQKSWQACWLSFCQDGQTKTTRNQSKANGCLIDGGYAG